MRRAIKRINEDQARTERLLEELKRHRAFQKSMNFKDDTHDDGQMLTAAMKYIELSRQQVRSRNPDWTEQYTHNRNPWVQPGGSEAGYMISKHTATAPSDWPWEEAMWQPQGPRYNLIRAATLIVAELERLERADRKALGLDKPQPKPKPKPAEYTTPLVEWPYLDTLDASPCYVNTSVGPLQSASTAINNTWPVGNSNVTSPSPLVLSSGTI